MKASHPHEDFLLWLAQLRELGWTYEIVVEDGYIDKVHLRMPDDGDWSNVRFGRIIGSKVVCYKQMVYLPRLIEGKFIYNCDVQK